MKMIFNHDEEAEEEELSPGDLLLSNSQYLFQFDQYRRRSPRLTGKKRLNYAEQLANIESLQMLMQMRKESKEEEKRKQMEEEKEELERLQREEMERERLSKEQQTQPTSKRN